jgi:hypothetical protein
MKKYILISLVLHSLILIINLTNNLTTKSKQLQIATEKKEGKGTSYNQIIDLVESNSKSNISNKKVLKDFYWGIGINTDFQYRNNYFGYIVSQIHNGYSADTQGLKLNDYIYLIDSMPITDINDIRGYSPRKMILTIIRNGVNMTISISRVKVYY